VFRGVTDCCMGGKQMKPKLPFKKSLAQGKTQKEQWREIKTGTRGGPVFREKIKRGIAPGLPQGKQKKSRTSTPSMGKTEVKNGCFLREKPSHGLVLCFSFGVSCVFPSNLPERKGPLGRGLPPIYETLEGGERVYPG